MKTFQEFIAEAKRIKFYTLHHGTSPEAKKSIQQSGFRNSGSAGAYGPGVYTSTNRRVANVHGSSTITMRVPAKKVKTMDIKPKSQSGTNALDKGETAVRIPNAGTRTSAYRNLKGKKHFVVVDKDVANKNIVKNPSPTLKSGKEKRTKTQPKKK